MINDSTYQGRKASPEPLLAHYTAARLGELDRCLAEARNATASDSAERRRLELVQQGLEYTQHVCSIIAHLSDPGAPATLNTEWKKQPPYFVELARNPYFGMAHNLTKLRPALLHIHRQPHKGAE